MKSGTRIVVDAKVAADIIKNTLSSIPVVGRDWKPRSEDGNAEGQYKVPSMAMPDTHSWVTLDSKVAPLCLPIPMSIVVPNSAIQLDAFFTDDTPPFGDSQVVPEKKKRGRKPKEVAPVEEVVAEPAVRGNARCPACNAPEVPANTPRTRYACGSSDYDGKEGTFERSEDCEEGKLENVSRK